VLVSDIAGRTTLNIIIFGHYKPVRRCGFVAISLIKDHQNITKYNSLEKNLSKERKTQKIDKKSILNKKN
jgi:hypothetical protein